MAMNLRLRDEAVVALRAESERTGLSQQEILRRAVDDHLNIGSENRPTRIPEGVEPAAETYRRSAFRLPATGVDSTRTLADLREDRS